MTCRIHVSDAVIAVHRAKRDGDMLKGFAGLLTGAVDFLGEGDALLSGLTAQERQLELRFNAGNQFARGEGFRKVVVRAGCYALDSRLLAGTGGKHDDRD